MNPKYPVYVISKGRWESRLTSKALEKLVVPYRIVIEPQEYEQYSAVVDSNKILVLPFSNLGKGSIPARNWVWDYSLSEGHERHWILDDNIRGFYRLHRNKKYFFTNGTCFRIVEDWTDRYKNVALSGMQYELFAPAKQKAKPILFNTRIYSCILVNNDMPYRWRGRYNEDTDLSLRVLKDGWCTALFYIVLADKVQTMKMKGGNTDEIYGKTNNRLEFAQSLYHQHPDVVKITKKWGRYHHQVDYRPFKKNKLILKDGIEIPEGINNYGMELIG